MRNRAVHDALRELTLDVSRLLTADLDAGAELAFEVLEEGGGGPGPGPTLYRYRPRTADFIAERWDAVRELPSHHRAVAALGAGAAPYLRHRGRTGDDADEALWDVIERLFDDASSFGLEEERFRRVHAELDATLGEAAVTAIVAAPLHGVRIATNRVELGEGLALVRRSAVDVPPAPLEGAVRELEDTAALTDAGRGAPRTDELDVVCVVERQLEPDAPLPVDEARVLMRRALTALRLGGAGATALSPLAWARAGEGAWHAVALGVTARPRPGSWELRYAAQAELSEILDVVARSRHGETVGWALERFEMGCERTRETAALSDYLLALRALLADQGGGGDASMALRIATLCAPEPERRETQARVERALALERHLMYGERRPGAAIALDSPHALVREVEEWLRAILRDVLSGYLDEDLRAAADGLLVASGAGPLPGFIDARDTRGDPPAAEHEDTRELEPVPALAG